MGASVLANFVTGNAIKNFCSWLYAILYTYDSFPESKACQINVSQESTEGFWHVIVMDHYFYMGIVCIPSVCYNIPYIDMIDHTDVMQRTYVIFLSYSTLQESSHLLQKKIILFWLQNNSKTILYLMGERPLALPHLFSISALLSYIYSYIYMYICMFVYVYISTHISCIEYPISVLRCNLYPFSFLQEMCAKPHCGYKIPALTAISSIHQLFLICSNRLFV